MREEVTLHCFFGLALRPDGVPVTPPMPAGSSLVLSHCALTTTTTGPVTLYVQSHEQPHRFALCTLSPKHGIYYVPLQLVFSKKVSFTLVAAGDKLSEGDRAPRGKRDGKQKKGTTAQAAPAQPEPALHLTGYFEVGADELDGAASSDDEVDSGSAGGDYDVGDSARNHATSGGGRRPQGGRDASTPADSSRKGDTAANNNAETRRRKRKR
ncbi:hypothetical protein TraAM80_07342 [Trypanosoma rangeli]|uniref:Nucleoplasmin-like domain-containing protein n=1 Tax=Trypanosoma rangeli TaxID=5698 RepID=A0A422N682_TRYRA|nr:uncharacterized protein TraAM80_07342 [Trypanosoma rangeli]RNF00942.1 hypothetical protein TraAM80_07342 [Trypanosoma rangeli]|eukprot:RNF00942.1 hypothetical protein TraAM80_07342 [Trypanosoma rangeli]